ncbi:MAG: endopeptidase La [Breznakibacter sp.]
MEKIKLSLTDITITDQDDHSSNPIPLVANDNDVSNNDLEIPEILPILPLRNTVLFPGIIIPITLGRYKSKKLIQDVLESKGFFGTVAQIDPQTEDPSLAQLHATGTVAKVIKVLEMPDNTTSVIIQGKRRFSINELVTNTPYLYAKVSPLVDIHPAQEQQREFDALVSSLKDLSLRIVKLSHHLPPEAAFAIKNIENPTFLINFICANTDTNTTEKQKFLGCDDLQARGMLLLEVLVKDLQLLELKNDIQAKVKTDLDQQQREYFLNQQLKTIQNELGGNPVDVEIENLKKKATIKKWTKDVADTFEKETEKLKRLNPVSPEYSVQYNYLQTLLDLPWNECTTDNFDLSHAEKVLDRDHFGLEKVKERILEHLAVLKLKGDLKSPIICLAGPPGVGKTSLGKSVAEALGRKYVRMSLGGLHDEAEIRGHRKTYIGAMPGRIIQNIKKAGSSNPVFILDEIDKISASFHGDPSSALLEVLDPEQNTNFHDNFLDVDFDLSKVMFIATANSLATISPPLLDRMEVIDVSGYILEEKVEIATRHIIPKAAENHGIKKQQISLPAETISYIVEHYTHESGVRELDKTLSRLFRKVALKIASKKKFPKSVGIAQLNEYLGVERFSKDRWMDNHHAGVVTGLAWTAAGGEILFVESSLSKGNGKLTLTGNLGDVMKESAILALEYLKAHAGLIDLSPEVFDAWNIHIHVPQGAIPKDGPSAGITLVTSLASVFSQKKVAKETAMTGEITLRGKVLPVGGIKEKILAAKRAGIKRIILSGENKKDVSEINPAYLEGLEFKYVDEIREVLSLAITNEKVENPVAVDAKGKEVSEK